jgi:hypothetical protein
MLQMFYMDVLKIDLVLLSLSSFPSFHLAEKPYPTSARKLSRRSSRCKVDGQAQQAG